MSIHKVFKSRKWVTLIINLLLVVGCTVSSNDSGLHSLEQSSFIEPTIEPIAIKTEMPTRVTENSIDNNNVDSVLATEMSLPTATPEPTETISQASSDAAEILTLVQSSPDGFVNAEETPLVIEPFQSSASSQTQASTIGHIYLGDMMGAFKTLLVEAEIDLIHPTWSTNCNQIAVVGQYSFSDGTFDRSLFIIDLENNGSISEARSDLQGIGSLSWAPHGTQIVYDAYDGNQTQIYTYSFETGEIVQLTSEGNNFEPSWSPDGSSIAFATDRHEKWSSSIYVMNADGTEQKQLLPIFWGAEISSFDDPMMINPEQPVWSPDGQWIAFRVTENINDMEAHKIYIMGRDGTNPHVVVVGDRHNDDVTSEDFYYIFEGNPNWSPDSQQILYLRSNPFATGNNSEAVCIVDVFTGVNTCHTTAPNESILSVDWCSKPGG